MSGPDKRQHERVPASGVAIRVKFNDVAHLEQYFLRDISRGGVFLRAKNIKALHDQLYVVLALPDGNEVKLRGEVVHVVTAEEATPQRPSGMGVQFLDLTAEIKKQLEDYIARLKQRRTNVDPLAGKLADLPPSREGSAEIKLPDPPPVAAKPAQPIQRMKVPTPAAPMAAQKTPSVVTPMPAPKSSSVVTPMPQRSSSSVVTPMPARKPVPTPTTPIPARQPAAPDEFKKDDSSVSGATYEEENDHALLRRLCWLLAEGSVMGRPGKEIFGVGSTAPAELRREVYERFRKALAPERPPRFLGAEEARAISRLLAMLESMTRED